MIKKILPVFFMAVMLLGVVPVARAVPAIEVIENDFQTINITVSSESVLHVTGASGMQLCIYNVTGVMVQNFVVDGADKSYSLNLPKGCYIVKVGKVIRKIYIR
ncbi:MAG: T9SS type A sorting domain-containing protein [Prevotella sp.]|nr:T9SS type A sorting domain-containing protein [Prevotella sp.]